MIINMVKAGKKNRPPSRLKDEKEFQALQDCKSGRSAKEKAKK